MIKAPLSHLPLNESLFQDSSFVVTYFAFVFIALSQRALLCGLDLPQTHNLPVTAC